MSSILIAAGWPIWPLFLVSILGLAILLERFWFLRRPKISPSLHLDQALAFSKTLIMENEFIPSESLIELGNQSPMGKILVSALMSKTQGLNSDQALENMRDVAAPIFFSFERYLGALATIATLAPLMGLFGTVIGMIDIFGSQSGSVANPQQLAHGISIALYNTAFGLLIAIPSLAGWRGLRAMADARQRECNDASRALLKRLYPAV